MRNPLLYNRQRWVHRGEFSPVRLPVGIVRGRGSLSIEPRNNWVETNKKTNIRERNEMFALFLLSFNIQHTTSEKKPFKMKEKNQ